MKYLLAHFPPARIRDGALAPANGDPEEGAIRPLKIRAKNWQFIGLPEGSPSLAELFTLVEECRLLGPEPETDVVEACPHTPPSALTNCEPPTGRFVRGGVAAAEASPKCAELVRSAARRLHGQAERIPRKSKKARTPFGRPGL